MTIFRPMAEIIKKPGTRQIRGRWHVTTDPMCVKIFNSLYELAEGYVCDGPSIPEFIPPAIISREDIFYPAIVHDALCSLNIEPRVVCDAVFWDLCCKSSNKLIASMAYAGVRLGQYLKYESLMPDSVWDTAKELFPNAYDSNQLKYQPTKYIAKIS